MQMVCTVSPVHDVKQVRSPMEQASFSSSAQSPDQGPPQAGSSESARAQTAGEYLDKALHLIGNTMRSAATLVKERSPREGVARNAFESASKVLDRTGQYMMRERSSRNLEGVVQKYPLRAVGVCFLFGLVAGSMMRGVRR
jgi:hypothetical protein